MNVTAYGYQVITSRRLVGSVWSVYPLESGGPVAWGRAWSHGGALKAAFRAVKARQ